MKLRHYVLRRDRADRVSMDVVGSIMPAKGGEALPGLVSFGRLCDCERP
jgi:hypothetical protein